MVNLSDWIHEGFPGSEKWMKFEFLYHIQIESPADKCEVVRRFAFRTDVMFAENLGERENWPVAGVVWMLTSREYLCLTSFPTDLKECWTSSFCPSCPLSDALFLCVHGYNNRGCCCRKLTYRRSKTKKWQLSHMLWCHESILGWGITCNGVWILSLPVYRISSKYIK